MKTIFLTQFGSHVYGTTVPTSDTDLKGLFVPDPKQILLQRDPKTIVQTTKLNKNAKNSSEDVDTEMFSLLQYMKLLMEGQTVSVDILFTPEKFWLMNEGETFKTLYNNRDQFLHTGTSGFVEYAKSQANKYGIKGSRVNAVRTTLEFLSTLDESQKLSHPKNMVALYEFVWSDPENKAGQKQEFINLIESRNPRNEIEMHLEVCNRKCPLHATVKYTKEIYQRIFDAYGARALAAEKNEGVDWKALMHATRICEQAQELFLTQNVTFPRPNADFLLKIRKGELPYKQVAEFIEQGMIDLEACKLKSTLPEKPNVELAEQIICDVYLNETKRI